MWLGRGNEVGICDVAFVSAWAERAGFSQSGSEDGTFEGERTISLLKVAWLEELTSCCGVNLAGG